MITWWLIRAEFVCPDLPEANELRYKPNVSCAWTLDKLMNQKTTRRGRLMTSVPVTHISSYSTHYMDFLIGIQPVDPPISFWSGSDEMTAWNAWNPSKFDTIWNKVGPHVVARLRTMQLYNKLWSRSCDPRYKALYALWPRFHAQPWTREAIQPYPAPSFPFAAELHVHWLQPWRKDRKGL